MINESIITVIFISKVIDQLVIHQLVIYFNFYKISAIAAKTYIGAFKGYLY